jgi:hypothetical protein
MKIAIISARYMEQNAIEAFLGQVFGFGQARVTVSGTEMTAVIVTDYWTVDPRQISVHVATCPHTGEFFLTIICSFLVD